MMVALLIFSLTLILLFPAAVNDTVALGLADPLKTALIGLGATIAVPIAIVALLISVVGIPLALFVGLIWLLILMVSGPLFSYLIGRLIWRSQHNVVAVMAVGVVVVMVAYLIPVLGALVFFGMLWMGTGMAIRQLLRSMPRPQYELARPGTAPAAAKRPQARKKR
jgi:hypothetical protein